MNDGSTPSRSNLNLFYTLDAILNAPSLTQAASQTNLSQPAISMALKKARLHFNDEIVTYVGGRRLLTPLAVALRPRVRRALRDAQQILDFSLGFDPARDARTIRLTMPDFVEMTFMPHVLKLVRELAPRIDVTIVPFEYWPAARQFEKDIDFVLLPSPLVDDSFGHQTLYEEQLAAMVAGSHPIAADGFLDEERYLSGSHASLLDTIDLLIPHDGPLADLLAARNIVVRTATYAALPWMIVDTDLIVTTSARYAQFCASIMDLEAVSLPIPSHPVDIVLQWPSHRDDEPVVDWFRQVLGQATAYI